MAIIGSAGGGGFLIRNGGSGGCYENFREKYKDESNTHLKNQTVTINLLDGLRRANYSHDYDLEVIGNDEEKDWFFEIPFYEDMVTNVWANDPVGGLQFVKISEEKSKTKLIIDFRKPLKKVDLLKFSFGYECDVLATINESFLTSKVTYTDWVSANVSRKELLIKVNVPPNSTSLQSIPPADLNHNPVVYDVSNLRALEYYNFVLNYKQKRIGKPFWIWVGSTTLSALIGGLISFLVTLR